MRELVSKALPDVAGDQEAFSMEVDPGRPGGVRDVEHPLEDLADVVRGWHHDEAPVERR
jgi:hypothetical protein